MTTSSSRRRSGRTGCGPATGRSAPGSSSDTCRTVVDPARQVARYTKGADGPVTDWWVYEDLAQPIPMVVASAGYRPEEFSPGPIAFDEMRPGCYDPKARLEDMDVNRVERSLCFPMIPVSPVRCSWTPGTRTSPSVACRPTTTG